MPARSIKFIMNSFPIVIFVFFIDMLVLRDELSIMSLTFAVLFSISVLNIFMFGTNAVKVLLKFISGSVFYYVLSLILLFGAAERILFICFMILTIFFGSKIYKYFIDQGLYITSFASVILSLFMFIMLREIEYEGDILEIAVPAVVVVNIALTFFRNNNKEIEEVSRTARKMPLKMLKNNRIMVMGLLTFTIIAAFIKEIIHLFEAVFKGIFSVIKAIFLFLLDLLSRLFYNGPADIEYEPDSPIISGPGSGARSSVFEYIMIAVASIILLVLIYLLLKKLIKFMIGSIKKLILYLGTKTKDGRKSKNTGYVDTVETKSIINVAREKIIGGILDFINDKNEQFKVKTKKEKIRYLYKTKIRKLRKHGFKYDISLTPNEIYEKQHMMLKEEILKKELTAVYNLVRYGNEDAENINIKNLK